MQTQSYSKFYLYATLLICVVFFLASCNLLNSDEDEEKDTPFVANFTNDWLPEDAEGFIVISDLQGQTLDAATWSGNTRIEFEPISDSRIIVTTGTRDAYSSTVYMTSNCYVKPGEWTWKGKPQSTFLGHVTLNFVNIPSNLAGGWLSGLHYQIDVYNFSSEINFPQYAEQDFLYLCCGLDDGSEVYLLVEDIAHGNTVTVDLGNLSTTKTTFINFHQTTSQYYINWQGYQTPGEYYQGSFPLLEHEEFGDNDWNNDISFCHAVETTHFLTEFINFDGPEHWNGDYWSFYDYGPIPSSTRKINADFTLVNSQPDSFQIDITGTADNVLSNWVSYDGWNQVRWRVFTNPDYAAFALPRMPDSIAIAFDLPYTAQFSLEDIEIMDYPDLDSHEEVIETLFQSDDYFFNIASKGVRIRTKQNNDSAQSNFSPTNTPNILKQKDPMIPIP